MSAGDGLELLRSVRERHDDLPLFLFTGSGSEAVASEAIATGVTDYLRKGVDPEQYTVLANRIRNAVATVRQRATYEMTVVTADGERITCENHVCRGHGEHDRRCPIRIHGRRHC